MSRHLSRSSPENSGSDTSDVQDLEELGPSKQWDNTASVNQTISETSFDNYFVQSHKPSRTSSNVFSSQIPPLSHEEFSTAVASLSTRKTISSSFDYRPVFPTFLLQLQHGFNLLLHGAGSKRGVLNAFAEYASKTWKPHVVVVNAFSPGFSIKDLLAAVERVPGVLSLPLAQRGQDAQILRIQKFCNTADPSARPICLVIHSVDLPALKSSKFRACLSSLCSIRGMHVLASVDNIASPMIWSLEEAFSRKPDVGEGILSRSCTWLWHDVTTLKSYDFELHHADRTSLSHHGARATAGDMAGNPRAALMTEVAARHILVSVTDKAKKLFALLGGRQIDLMDEVSSPQALEQLACEYSTLFGLARENFIATNDTSLRALMSEFKDHGLIISSVQTNGSEAVWIPLRKSALSNVIADLKAGKL